MRHAFCERQQLASCSVLHVETDRGIAKSGYEIANGGGEILRFRLKKEEKLGENADFSFLCSKKSQTSTYRGHADFAAPP